MQLYSAKADAEMAGDDFVRLARGYQRPHITGPVHLDLSDEEGAGLTKSLANITGKDRYPFSERIRGDPGETGTLRPVAAAQVRLIVWCKGCGHQVEPDPAEMATRYGAETSVLDWRGKLVCSKCGGRQADMVVTGTKQ